MIKFTIGDKYYGSSVVKTVYEVIAIDGSDYLNPYMKIKWIDIDYDGKLVERKELIDCKSQSNELESGRFKFARRIKRPCQRCKVIKHK